MFAARFSWTVARDGGAEVAFGEACVGGDRAGGEAHAQRRPGHEPDAEFLAQRQDLLSGPRQSMEYSF